MQLSFGKFSLDTDLRELRGPDGAVPMEPQAFDLLKYLVCNRDRVVSKEEVLSAIWGDRIVSPSVLSSRINTVRRAIGDDGNVQRYIRTFPRVGMRFVGTVLKPAEKGTIRNSDASVGLKTAPRPESDQYHPALDSRPSIAVLPFANLGGDADHEYFADGMVEEIITALSQMSWLSVIARNSCFVYKGKSVDIRQVGRELGARYVLEGSVRKSKERLRISGRLLDTSTGAHLWAGRFDGELRDVFELQDKVAENVVGAIAPHLDRAEILRARRKSTESLGAYDYYLRGLANVHRWNAAANDAALRELAKAVELDPEFAAAYGLAARCYSQRKSCGWMVDRNAETDEAERLAHKAAQLGADDAVALCMAGIVLAYVVGDVSHGGALIDKALALNSNLAWAWSFGSWVKIWQGDAREAAERAAHAIRLSPNDPEVLFFMQTATAYSHFLEGRHGQAHEWAEAAMRDRPGIVITMCAAAASGALCGEIDEARSIVEQLRVIQPDMTLSVLEDLFPFQRSTDAARWKRALEEAGLPK